MDRFELYEQAKTKVRGGRLTVDEAMVKVLFKDNDELRCEIGRLRRQIERLQKVLNDDCISRSALLAEFEEDQYHVDFCKEHGIDRSISMEMVRIRLHDQPSIKLESI